MKESHCTISIHILWLNDFLPTYLGNWLFIDRTRKNNFAFVTTVWTDGGLKKLPKCFQKLPKIISAATVFTSIDLFQNSPKVSNLFGLLLRVNLLPRTFKNCPIWSHCSLVRCLLDNGEKSVKQFASKTFSSHPTRFRRKY